MTIQSIQNTCTSIYNAASQSANYVGKILVDLIQRVITAVSDFFDYISLLFDECCADETYGPGYGLDYWDPHFPNRPPQPLPNLDPFLFNPVPYEPAANPLPNGPVNLDRLRRILQNREVEPHGNVHLSQQLTPAVFSALCREYPIHVQIRRGGGTLIREADVEKMDDAQAMLDAAREEVRRAQGGEAANRVRSTIQFPEARNKIGRWAETWAKYRTPRIDPAHPYFEIFQEAFRLKDQINGGIGSDGDYHNYSVPSENYYGYGANAFHYIIKLLIGFQELSRAENRELMRLLESHKSTFEQNPAYKFGRALGKIYCYPTANHAARGGYGEIPMDVNDKLQIGIGAPMTTFRLAQQHNQVLGFFQRAFNANNNCFDARVTDMQRFAFELTHPNIEDFTANVQAGQTIRDKLFEYYRVFKNQQIFRLSQIQRRDYQQLKNAIEGGIDRVLMENFSQNYCTKANFEAFLAEDGGRVKELKAVPRDRPQPPEVPMLAEWAGRIPQGIKRVPIDYIPIDKRQIGAVLGIKDPNRYLATVQIRGQAAARRAYLVFSRNHPAGYQADLPEIPYAEHWNGKVEEEIDLDRLPADRRANGRPVVIKDPAVYAIKVHSIDADGAMIDFRGDSVSRRAWDREDVLGADYWEA